MKEEAMFDEMYTKCGGTELDKLLILKTREKDEESFNTKERLNSSSNYHESFSVLEKLDRREIVAGITSNEMTERNSNEDSQDSIERVLAIDDDLK